MIYCFCIYIFSSFSNRFLKFYIYVYFYILIKKVFKFSSHHNFLCEVWFSLMDFFTSLGDCVNIVFQCGVVVNGLLKYAVVSG